MVLIKIILGLVLFLFGMKIMSSSLILIAEKKIKSYFLSFSEKPGFAFLVGVIATAFFQSSSLTTVMVVSLVHAKILNLPGAIAIILGANVGTTITAQILAFNIEQYSIYIILLSIAFYINKNLHKVSFILFGLGIMLTGLQIMIQSLSAILETQLLYRVLQLSFYSPLGGIFAGGIAAALIQSSSAIIAFVLTIAKENNIELVICMPIVFGADIGTCITSLIASMTTNIAGRRAAVAHFIFNVFSALIIIIIMPYFIQIVLLTSANLQRQIANGHTLYNLIGGLLFLPIIKPFSNLIIKIIPENNIYINK